MMRLSRPFTLIEIMIVMALLSLIGTVIAVNVQGWVKQERFRASVGVVEQSLNVAQDLMLIVGADSNVRIHQGEDKGWQCVIEPLDALPTGLDRMMATLRRLPGIDEVRFTAPDGQIEREDLLLPFISQGSLMAHGRLELLGNNERRVIELVGYPRRIRAGAGGDGGEITEEESERFYPVEVIPLEEKAPVSSR